MEADEAKDLWSTGSYAATDSKYLRMAGHIVEKAEVSSDDTVLDVGCGTGNVTITAARRGARVTGVDITPSMLHTARENAAIAGLRDIEWREGDATALPFDDDTFDVTLSCLGHMYGDPPGDVAAEICRVTRTGGRIGFVSWTPTTLYPAMAGVLLRYVSREELPDFSEPPFMWGDVSVVRTRLGDPVDDLKFETKTARFPVRSPGHFWQQTATYSSVFIQSLDTIDAEERPALREQMLETIEPYFDETENVIEMEYLHTSGSVS